jgi:hypothetical protein
LHPTLNNVAKMPRNPVAFSTRVFCLAERIKKMNSENDDVGIQTVQEIYNSLQVDEEWSKPCKKYTTACKWTKNGA